MLTGNNCHPPSKILASHNRRSLATFLVMSALLPALRWAERTCRVPADVVDRLDEVPPAAAADDEEEVEGKPMMRLSMLNRRDLLLRSTKT